MSDELANGPGSVQTSSNGKVKIMGPIPSTGLRETLVQIMSLAIPQATLRIISPDVNGQISICDGQTIVGARLSKRDEDGLPALRRILSSNRGMYAVVDPDQEFNFGEPLDVPLHDILEWRDLRNPQQVPTISQAVHGFDSPQQAIGIEADSPSSDDESEEFPENGSGDAVQVLLGIMDNGRGPAAVTQNIQEAARPIPAAEPDVQQIAEVEPHDAQAQPAYFEEPPQPAYFEEQPQPAYFEEQPQPAYFEEQPPALFQPALEWDIPLPEPRAFSVDLPLATASQLQSPNTIPKQPEPSPTMLPHPEAPNAISSQDDARISQQVHFNLEEARQIHAERQRQNSSTAASIANDAPINESVDQSALSPGSVNQTSVNPVQELGRTEYDDVPSIDWSSGDLNAIPTPRAGILPTPSPSVNSPPAASASAVKPGGQQGADNRTTGQWDLGALDSIRAPAVDSQSTSQKLSASQSMRNTKEFLKPQSTVTSAIKKGGGNAAAGRMIILSVVMSISLLGAIYLWSNQLMQESHDKQNFQLGLAFLKDNNADLAAQKLTAVIEKTPNNFEARYNRAKAYLMLNEWDKATDDFSFVLKEKPTDSVALVGRAKAYLKLEKFDASIADASAVIDANAKALDALQVRSEAYLGAGKFKESVQDANRIIDLKPADGLAEAYAQRAYANMKEKKYKEAVDDYTLAIEKDSNLGSSYAQRAQCFFQLKDFDKAIADCDKALYWSKLDTSTYMLRAECYKQTDRHEEALRDLDKAVTLKPGIETYGARAKALITTGNFTNAVEDLEQIMKIRTPHPQEYDGLLEMCYLKVRRVGGGETPEAPPPVVMPKGTFDEMVHQGYELMQQGNATDAVIWLNAAVKEKPRDIKARTYLAHALLSAGNAGGAVQQFLSIAKVRTLTLDEKIAYYKALQAMGQHQQANALLASLVREDPNNNVVRFYIVKDLAAKGDRQAAAEQCRIGIAKAKSAEESAPFREILQRLEKSFADAKARK